MSKGRTVFILAILMLLTLGGLKNTALSQEPELLAQWPLDETSGDVAHDIIGGNDGDLTGGKLEWVPAKFENGLQFDGAGSHVEIPRNPELEHADSVTLTAWVKLESAAGRQDIVSYGDSCSIMLEGGVFKAFIFQGDWPVATGTTAVTPGEWYFVAMTYDSSNVKVYVNGKLDGSIAAPGGITYQDVPLWFGGAPADPGQSWWLNGILDEIEMWNRAMTEDEILKVYKSPPPSLAVSSGGKLAARWGELKLR